VSPLPSRDEMAETLEDRVAQAIDNVTFGYAGGQRPPDELEDLTREVIALVAEHFAEMLEASATNYEASCWMDLAATLIRNGGVQS